MEKTKLLKRLVVLAVLVVVAALFFLLDLGQYLSLDYIKDSRARFGELYNENPAAVLGVYMLIYIAVTAFSLPGALVMTLAGGALFGLLAGTVVVSFASTIGATLACLAARFVLRDWVQEKVGDRLKTVNQGVEREGAFYLFTLRLVPIFPFWMINLVFGLTRVRLTTFYWVSQVGMLPGTLVFVNAGKELGKIDSLAGILSPGLIASFVILGIFPIAAKKLVDFFRRKTGRIAEEQAPEISPEPEKENNGTV